MSEIGFTFVFATQLPVPWPPTKEWLLFERLHDQGLARVFCTSDGSFSALVTWTGHSSDSTRYQALIVPEGAMVVIGVRAVPGHTNLRVNGTHLLADFGEDVPPLRIEAKATIGSEKKLLFPGLSAAQGGTEHRRLFLGKVAEIDQKLLAGDWYSLVAASGLIRSLVIDKTPIVHLVNRDFSLKLRFRSVGRVFELPALSKSYELTLWIGGIPPLGESTKLVSLDELLDSPFLMTADTVLAKVSDLIKLCANVKGGIHVDTSRKDPHVALVDWENQFPELHRDMNVNALSSIGTALLEGLTPLVEEISTSKTV